MWWWYALLSAVFAALTAVLAKVGIKGVNSDLATAIRTVVILVVAWGIVLVKDHPADIFQLSPRTWVFLGLSGVFLGETLTLKMAMGALLIIGGTLVLIL
jgi:transporter family protein